MIKCNRFLAVPMVAAGLMSVGCGAGVVGSATQPAVAGFALEVDTADHVKGTYVVGEVTAAFDSVQLEPGVFDVAVELNGQTLTAVVNPSLLAVDYDGFTTLDGSDTSMLAADREILNALSKELSERFGADEFSTGDVLNRAVTWWGQVPETMNLKMEVLSDINRGVDRLCGYYLQFFNATHDCTNGSDGSARTTRPTQIGFRGDGGTEEFCLNGAWTPNWDRNHDPTYLPKQTGGCYGRCGADCPSTGTNQVITRDCAKHDLCSVMHQSNLDSCTDEAGEAADDIWASNCDNTKLANEAGRKGVCP